MDQRPGSHCLGAHVSQHPLQALKLADRASKLFPVLAEFQCGLKCTAGQAKGNSGGANALTVIGFHQFAKATAQTTGGRQHHVFGYFHILEGDDCFRNTTQSHGGFTVADHQTGSFAMHGNKTGNALFFARFIENPGKNQK